MRQSNEDMVVRHSPSHLQAPEFQRINEFGIAGLNLDEIIALATIELGLVETTKQIDSKKMFSEDWSRIMVRFLDLPDRLVDQAAIPYSSKQILRDVVHSFTFRQARHRADPTSNPAAHL